ncbi:MAG: response regulator [Pacificimonas sp.]|jgi:CheY-like chemotaxis protein|nr:response regulator [Pacificimonas sp.]
MADREEHKKRLKGKHILIAEDQIVPAMSLEAKLRYSGAVAIRICERLAACMSVIDNDFHPDVAIIDVDMAGKDGRELARELQRRGVPFMFHTGKTRDELSEFGDEVPIIPKPSTEDEIIKTLASLFPKHGG